MPKRATLSTRAISTSTATTDQLPKGSGLTTSELDSNFLELRDQTFGVVGDDSATIDIAAGGTLYIQGGTNVTTSTNSDGSITINSTGGGGDIGDLRVTAFGTYTDDTFLNPSVTDANLILAGNNAGVVAINDSLVMMSSATNIPSYSKSTLNPSSLVYIGANSNSAVWKYTIQSGTDTSQPETTIQLLARSVLLNNNINTDIIAPGGNGDFRIQNGGDAGTKGVSPLSVGHNFITLTDNNDGEIQINHKEGKWTEIGSRLKFFQNEITTLQSNDDLVLTGNGTGSVTINGFTMPTSDGISGQALVTNGSGVLSFAAVDASINIDGGTAESTYGGITAIDGGDAT
jgi:hypothetical protein